MSIEQIPSPSIQCDAAKKSQTAVQKRIDFLNDLPSLPEGYNSPVERVKDPFDIQNLRYHKPYKDEVRNKQINLTPQLVDDFVEKMNQLSEDSDKLFVIGVGTGGTISMTPGDKGSLVPDLDFNSIMDKADPRLKKEFEILGLDAYATDSSQLDIDDVGDMAIAMSYIWERMKPGLRKRFAGFFVVHGTDTMPKAAGHLEMMLGKNVPFNFLHTGAQKPINQKVNDAQNNVQHGLYTLKMLHTNNCAEGVTVMGGLALLSAGMTKVSDHNARAMATHMHRPIVDFGELPDPDKHELPKWLREKPSGKRFNPVVYRGPNRIGSLNAEMQEDPSAAIAELRLKARKAMLLVTYGANTYDVASIKQIGEEAKEAEYSSLCCKSCEC